MPIDSSSGKPRRLALPPVDLWPAPFVTFPILVWLVDGAAPGRLGGAWAAASAGWWFGFGYFLAGLYWIGNAFLVDAKTFGWLLPFAVTALPASVRFPAGGIAVVGQTDTCAREHFVPVLRENDYAHTVEQLIWGWGS